MTTAEDLPHFIIGGAAKSATTWLQRSLQRSPGIFMPDHEPHFFARHYDDGIDAYRRLFSTAPPDAMRGEKSNSYLTVPAAAARIALHVPDVRLVFQLRDPVTRAYSDYKMLLHRGTVDRDIRRYLDPARAAEQRFLHNGRYADHLARFYDLFAREQLLVLKYEDISRDPAGQLDRLARHLRLQGPLAPPLQERIKDARAATVPRAIRRLIAPFRPIVDPIRHTAPVRALRKLVARREAYPELDAELKTALAAFYQEQVERLTVLTGMNFSDWLPMRTAGVDLSGGTCSATIRRIAPSFPSRKP